MKGSQQKPIFQAVVLLINFQEAICTFECNEHSYSLWVRKCYLSNHTGFPPPWISDRGNTQSLFLDIQTEAENHGKKLCWTKRSENIGLKICSGHQPNFFKKKETSSLDIKKWTNQAGQGLSSPGVLSCSWWQCDVHVHCVKTGSSWCSITTYSD